MINATLRPRNLVLSVIIFAVVVVIQLVLLVFFESRETEVQYKVLGEPFGFFQKAS